MNIASTQYTLKYKSFELYLSGCNGSCDGCCNPELKDFSSGESIDLKLGSIIEKINTFSSMIKSIWILGGDPVDQDQDDLIELLSTLRYTRKEIWLWTRYSFDQISDSIKKHCDYIKCGEYVQDLKTENNIQYGVKLATSNQIIHKMENNYEDQSGSRCSE